MGFRVSFVYSGRHEKRPACASSGVDAALGWVESGRVTWTRVFAGYVKVKGQIWIQVVVAGNYYDVILLLWYSLGDGCV